MVPPRERGKYSGLVGGVFALASVLGPLIGGAITDSIGWRWVFYVNLPIGAVCVPVIWFGMKKLSKVRYYSNPKNFIEKFVEIS